MVQRHLPTLAATFLAASVVLGSAVAMSQTTPPTGPTVTSTNPAPNGPYESLSPGNQKIVRALYQAQRTDLPGTKLLTLDQIAAKKGHTGWGDVFKSLQSKGLIEAKNLGQVIRTYNHRHHVGAVTTAANRSEGGDGNAGTPHRDTDRDVDDHTGKGHLNGLKQDDGSHISVSSAGRGLGGGAGLAGGRGR